jgi:hypothetical protein
MNRLVQRLVAIFIVSFFALLSLSAPVLAAPAPATKPASAPKKEKPSDISGAISQSYNADGAVQVGMIVQLKDKDSSTIAALNSKMIKSMFGVVIPVSGAPIVLAPKVAKQQQLLVATSGRQTVLVSNQNGPIKINDYISISAVDGIGMKAGEAQEQIVGKAAAAFTGTANVAGTVKLKDSTGKEATVAIGRIVVDVNITHNPLNQKTVDFVPGFLAGIAVTVANKPVSVARIYLCTIILFVAAIISGIMLYSGIRSGMIAVGRNPLSKKSIIKSLIQTVIAGVIVFIVGVFAVYLLLKL